MARKTERAVVVCTMNKGVFFGYALETDGDLIVISRARMCVYWSAAMKGVLGLASQGPNKDCKISDPVPSLELRGITCVIECTPEAAKKWEENGWKP